MKNWTPTQTACLLAILIIFGIGCERQKHGIVVSDKTDTVGLVYANPVLVADTGKIDTTSWITQHSEIQPGY